MSIGHHLLVLGHGRVVIPTADQALDGEEGVVRVGDRLAFRGLADKRSSFLKATMEGVVRAPSEFSITRGRCDTVHDGDTRVCGAEVDTDDFRPVYNATVLPLTKPAGAAYNSSSRCEPDSSAS
jgi:hypothetical protein